ncbi:hypothetical protein Tco_1000710, partial [Tanacetum coccineum]
FYPRFLTAISGRRWILTYGLKLVLLKCLQSLEYWEGSLKSKKDASIVDLTNSLRLEGPLAEIPRTEDLQPSSTQLMLPIHRPKDNVIKEKRLSLTDDMVPFAEPLSSKSLTSEASTSVAPATSEPITTLSMTFASSDVVPPFSISNDQVFDMKPHDEDPFVVTFEKEELDTSLE